MGLGFRRAGRAGDELDGGLDRGGAHDEVAAHVDQHPVPAALVQHEELAPLGHHVLAHKEEERFSEIVVGVYSAKVVLATNLWKRDKSAAFSNQSLGWKLFFLIPYHCLMLPVSTSRRFLNSNDVPCGYTKMEAPGSGYA